MKRTPKLPKVYSSTIDATKAATFYDRLHALKDAIEALQSQYTEDMAEVYEEASEALNADPTCLRMAFTEERQKRKREARIAKMDAAKAHQLDLLGDVAGGSDVWEAARGCAPGATGGKSSEQFVREQREEWDRDTGEITELHTPREGAATPETSVEDRQDTAAPASQPSYDVIGEIPSFLLREQAAKPPPQPLP